MRPILQELLRNLTIKNSQPLNQPAVSERTIQICSGKHQGFPIRKEMISQYVVLNLLR